MELAEDELNHGASAVCEILSPALADVQMCCFEKRLHVPEHLVVQPANTAAQATKSIIPQLLVYLVDKGKLLTGGAYT